MNVESFRILDVKIDALNMSLLKDIIDGWIESKLKKYVVLTGVHGIIEMQTDEKLKTINNNSDLTTPDGMPVVWLGKWKGFKEIEKVYAPDIMNTLYEFGLKKKYRHFLYGGGEGVAEKLVSSLNKKYPGILISGTFTPPFRPLTEVEKEEVANLINKSGADIVWCGLGCPKQEYWMDEFRNRLEAPVLIGVGAGFDFLSGIKPLAPRWISRSGFEWLYRIFSDPGRLTKRYSKIIPKFIYLIIKDSLTKKNNKLEL
jgi:N-acetylglucosaminyldiphosphoundecaprenol N-acetyl-beta-D-mannosaminyltransferase